MAFNSRIPNPIPPLDLDGLLKLISSPQKAAEVWEQYKQAREAYEALRASIAEEKAALDKQAAEQDARERDLVKTGEDYSKTRAQFQNEMEQARASWVKRHSDLDVRATALADKAAVLEAREKAADAMDRDLSIRADELNEWKACNDTALSSAHAALAAREAAVAVREEKAKKLAELVKSV